jgi:tetratricopeptide (TPR) repeat protein
MANLAAVRFARYELTRDLAHLEEAIGCGREALQATRSSGPDRARLRGNLAEWLRLRSMATGSASDAEEAVRWARSSLTDVPAPNPDRADYLSSLEACLHTWFRYTGRRDRLDEAIAAGREAVASSSGPDRAECAARLADALRTRHQISGGEADLDEALRNWRQAGATATARPWIRLSAWRRAADLSAQAGRWPQASAGLGEAVELLPQLAWIGLTRGVREGHLRECSGLAPDSTAAAMMLGEPHLALARAEQGRAVLWAQALNLRSDLSDLALADAGIAARLDRLRTLLNAPLSRTSPAEGGESHDVPGR